MVSWTPHPFASPAHAGRLTLRRAAPSDRDFLLSLWSDPAFLGAWGYIAGEKPDAYLSDLTDACIVQGNAVILEEDGRPVGTMDLRAGPEPEDKPTIGWYVVPGGRGRGLARAAADLALSRLFEAGGQTMYIMVEPANKASLRVARSLGFRLLGRGGDGALCFDLSKTAWKDRVESTNNAVLSVTAWRERLDDPVRERHADVTSMTPA